MLEPLTLPFFQRGLVEALVLALAAGVLGTWIVLRGLAFYSHAVATASFPGLVLADGLGFAPQLGALGAAALLALAVSPLASGRRRGSDSATALALAAALAAGVVLASDVFHSGSSVETLLFGSLLLIGPDDIALAGAAAALALCANALLGWRWLQRGLDEGVSGALGERTSALDGALLALVALAAVAALAAVGALLAGALLVVPAATTRLLVDRMPAWQLATVALAAAEGVLGLWLSVRTNAPPGATIAATGGVGFALAALARALRPGRRVAPVAALAAGLLAVGALGGCAGAGTSSGGRLLVVATTTQLGDFAREVGGRDVQVHQILRPSTDPHDYEPRPRDVLATADARLVLASGDGLDRWIDDVVDDAGGAPSRLDLATRVPVRRGADPHWWHDPRNAEAAVAAIRDALVAAEPAHRSAYERNAAAYLARLRALDAGIARCLSAIPPADRKLVTDHDAFGYFAARYGLRVVGAVIPSQATDAQSSGSDVSKLVDTIRREHVRAIFPESAVSPKLARAIARETGATPGGELRGDTLGPEGSAAATYLGMERANADAIARGLSGGRLRCRLEAGA